MGLRSAKKEDLQRECPNVVFGKEQLGEGGNGRVLSGTSSDHGPVAVKFLLNIDSKRYTRFKDEVLVVTGRLKDSPRVVPILEHSLPDAIATSDIPWYVMPRASTLRDALKGQDWDFRLEALLELAEGLAELHEQEVAHRDIKPENLFLLEGTYRFGDFGIAAFPERSGITEDSEPMGPAGYMAPEMMRNTSGADAKLADVYSFAKTVWAILANQKVVFGGPYEPNGIEGLIHHVESKDFVVEPLDTLLERATSAAPAARPTAREFADALREVMEVQSDFQRANTLQWGAAEVQAIRVAGPARVEWTDVSEIANVLGLLSRRRGLNHLFFADGGGLTVERVSTCESGEMLSLYFSESFVAVVKPKRLTLERFSFGPKYGYVVLETSDIEPLGVDSQYSHRGMELVRQLNSHDYIEDDSEADESRSRGLGRLCHRYFESTTFVIAPTGGLFNLIDDYNGTGISLGRDVLRARFEELVRRIEDEEASKPGWSLMRAVRLLSTTVDADVELKLQYISNSRLQELVDADDAVQAERRKAYRGGGLGTYEDMMDRMQMSTPAADAGLALIQKLSKEEKAEYLSLVELARQQGDAGDLAAFTDGNIKGGLLEDGYLAGKLGNGYMRRALARFGMNAPATVVGEASTQD